MMCRLAFVAALSLAAADTATAQAPAASPLNTVISTNPLGFLQLGPNIEYERSASDGGAWAIGARLPSLGLMSHVINDGIQSGYTGYAVWHFYPQGTRLRGWYVGPHVEIGRTDNETYKSNLLGGGGEFGYRWVKPNGFSIVLGGMLGSFKSDDTWKDGTGSAGSENYFVWMLNFSLGVAR